MPRDGPGGAVAALYVFTVLGGVRLGAFFVLVAWAALEASDSVAVVGHMFLIGSATSLVLGPAMGALVDRRSRRGLLLLSHGAIAAAVSWPVGLALSGMPLQTWHLYVIAAVGAVATVATTGAADAILQAVVPPGRRPPVVAVTGALRQAALVAGTGAAGYAIHLLGPALAFGLPAAATLGAMVAIRLLPDAAPPAPAGGWRRHVAQVRDGLAFSLRHPVLLPLGLATALSFTAGQLTNALLPAYVRDVVGAGSGLYGLVEAAWAAGGMLAAGAVAGLLRRRPLVRLEFAALVALGISTMAFATLSSPAGLVAVHAMMGVCFSTARVLCDARLLDACPNERIGRVRANVSAMTSACGLVVYLAPGFLTGVPVPVLYLGWGCFLGVCGAVLWSRAARVRGWTVTGPASP